MTQPEGIAPSLAKGKYFKKIAIAMVVIIAIAFLISQYKKREIRQEAKEKVPITAQIHPNYQFPPNCVQIDVRLLPEKQVLSREAGGWIITPAGSSYRIDYDIPIVIEYIDGRKSYRQPGRPVDDGVRLSNGIFRLYGRGDGIAKVTIKRDVF